MSWWISLDVNKEVVEKWLETRSEKKGVCGSENWQVYYNKEFKIAVPVRKSRIAEISSLFDALENENRATMKARYIPKLNDLIGFEVANFRDEYRNSPVVRINEDTIVFHCVDCRKVFVTLPECLDDLILTHYWCRFWNEDIEGRSFLGSE